MYRCHAASWELFWRAADCARARTVAGTPSGTSEYELYDCKNHIKMIIVDNEVALTRGEPNLDNLAKFLIGKQIRHTFGELCYLFAF